MTTCAHSLAPAPRTTDPDDPFTFEYTLTGPKNTGTLTFIGRIVQEIPVELMHRETRERFMGVRLVLENRAGHRITTVGMRKRDVREVRLHGSRTDEQSPRIVPATGTSAGVATSNSSREVSS